MGKTASKSCAEGCTEQISKLEAISQICCADDFDGHDFRKHRLIVSKANKNKSAVGGNLRQTEKFMQPYIYSCEEPGNEFSETTTQDHVIKVTRLDNANNPAEYIKQPPRGMPVGWSEDEIVQLKAAIDEACLKRRVKYPSFFMSQVSASASFPTPHL